MPISGLPPPAFTKPRENAPAPVRTPAAVAGTEANTMPTLPSAAQAAAMTEAWWPKPPVLGGGTPTRVIGTEVGATTAPAVVVAPPVIDTPTRAGGEATAPKNWLTSLWNFLTGR